MKEPKPIVQFDLVDGQEVIRHFFDGVTAAYEYYLSQTPPQNVWKSRIYECIMGRIKWAKRKRFRYASQQEIDNFNAALIKLEESKAPEKITPNYDDWLPGDPEDIIPATSNKKENTEQLSPFEERLRKMGGE